MPTALAVAGVVSFAACGGGPRPEDPAPPDGGLVRRHWDQVCAPRWRPDELVGVHELFDTLGLGAQLREADLVPPTRAGVERSVHFMTHYGRVGSPERSGVWESTEPPEAESRIEGILRSRMRTLPGLLDDTGFHTLLTLTPWPRLAIAGAVECLPHMVHHGGEPPVGLPESVRVWVGQVRVRDGDAQTVGVRLSVDADGTVTDQTRTAGEASTYREAAAIIRNLVFEPALRNGIPVPTTLDLGFYFLRPIPPAHSP